MMKLILLISWLFVSLESNADIYDDFVEEHIVKTARENLIKRYRSEEVPDEYDSKIWAESTEKVIQKVNRDLAKSGSIFSSISSSYREVFTPEDMIVLFDLVTNTTYQELMKKNRVVKSNVEDALQDYIFDDLINKADELRWQE